MNHVMDTFGYGALFSVMPVRRRRKNYDCLRGESKK